MKTKTIGIAGLIIILLLATGVVLNSGGKTFDSAFERSEGERVNVSLEIADTTSERRHGLMHRVYLPRKQGMIFVYEDSAERSFWMKNTYIPLDMIFISEDLTIINIKRARPQPFTQESELKSYQSEGDARYVVEMRRGFAERNNLERGDKFVPGPKVRSCCITGEY